MGALTIRDNPVAHRLYPIQREEDVGALRRAVRDTAKQLPGLAEGAAELVATELAANIVHHTPGGYVLMRPAGNGIELIAVDRGRGLPEPALTWLTSPDTSDGGRPESTRPGGLGVGLAGVRRRAELFDCYSNGRGTVILVRLDGDPSAVAATTGPWRWGGVTVPLGGQGPSGDSWAVAAGTRLAAVLVDGLGHGPDAANAAHVAVTIFDQQPLSGGEEKDDTPDPEQGLIRFTAQADRAMRGTRGGVIGVAVLDQAGGRVVYAGIGNVTGRLCTADSNRHLVSHSGSVGTGLTSPRARPESYPWPSGATLLLASDGIDTRWEPSRHPGLLCHHPTVIAAVVHRDHTRGTDDAAVLVIRAAPSSAQTGGGR